VAKLDRLLNVGKFNSEPRHLETKRADWRCSIRDPLMPRPVKHGSYLYIFTKGREV